MKASRPSNQELLIPCNPVVELARDRSIRIPIYAERVAKGLPLFEDEADEEAVPVKVIHTGRNVASRFLSAISRRAC